MKKRVFIVVGIVLLASLAPLTHTLTLDVQVDVKPRIRTKATMEEKHRNRMMAMKFAQHGWDWDASQRKCIRLLFTKESRFDHLAKNQQGSSAFGIAQMLKETSKDPAVQILNAYRYIEHRYDTPCRAWNHSQRRNWY
jgi:predicted GNAT family acetyltransferase